MKTQAFKRLPEIPEEPAGGIKSDDWPIYYQHCRVVFAERAVIHADRAVLSATVAFVATLVAFAFALLAVVLR